MNIKYPYLTDTDFLRDFDELQLKEQFVKIVVLDWEENPIQEIQGQVTAGSVNIDGQSSVRRTCNITFIADEDQAHISDVSNLLSINKKIKLEIGFTNITKQYKSYRKIWFPLGTYLIINPSISHNNGGITISLQLKDKMCLLNGECGGVITSAVDFANLEQYDETGTLITTKPTIYQIIQELVHHFGHEQLGNILISGLDKKVKQVVQWQGDKPLYMITKVVSEGEAENEIGTAVSYTTDLQAISNLREGDYFKEFAIGEDIGYQLVDFVYPDELMVDAGATVASVLDTIKEKLGNFEYFYDLDGHFVFQEIRNYLNTSYSTSIINSELTKNKDYEQSQLYLIDRSKGKTVYRFSNQKIITSYANTPQYNMIKNDFVVWGTRKTIDGLEFPIRYHLAIDDKPEIGNIYSVCFYYDEEKGYEVPFVPVNPIEIQTIELKYYGDNWEYPDGIPIGKYLNNLTGAIKDPMAFYYIKDRHIKAAGAKSPIINYLASWSIEEQRFKIAPYKWKRCFIKTTDWRSELFLQGLRTRNSGRGSNDYYSELLNEWPKLYDLKATYHDLEQEKKEGLRDSATVRTVTGATINNYYEGAWREEAISNVTSLDYFLDFVTPLSKLGGISVKSIGRRSKVLNDKGINCVFEPEVPDYILISTKENTEINRRFCVTKGYDYIQVDDFIIDGLSKGGHYNSAFATVQDLLYQHTSYNESITINCLPIYYLEPNTRIYVHDEKSDIQGDYVIKSLSLPLDINGTMTITAGKAMDKI